MADIDKHVEIDEILDFLSIDKPTKEKLILADYIFSHNAKCKECQEKYNRIIAISESLDKEFSRITNEERIKIIALNEIIKIKQVSNTEIDKIQNLLKGIALSVKIHINDFSEITGEAVSRVGVLSHPRLAMDLRSTDESVRGAEILSTLNDNDNDKITINRDGSLIISLNRHKFAPGTMVILVPDDENGASYSAETTINKNDPNLVEACFSDVELGDYSLLIR